MPAWPGVGVQAGSVFGVCGVVGGFCSRFVARLVGGAGGAAAAGGGAIWAVVEQGEGVVVGPGG